MFTCNMDLSLLMVFYSLVISSRRRCVKQHAPTGFFGVTGSRSWSNSGQRQCDLETLDLSNMLPAMYTVPSIDQLHARFKVYWKTYGQTDW